MANEVPTPNVPSGPGSIQLPALRGSTAVAGVAGNEQLYYMGSTGGGVWKTTDAGTTWTNISDGFFEAGSIGAITVAESNPNIIYVGTGSACPRGNVSPGEVMEIRLAVWDTGGHIFDSLVLLDAWEWSLEPAQPGVSPG